MLIAIPAIVKTLGQSRVKPSVYLSPTAQPASNSPAINSSTQATTDAPYSKERASSSHNRVRRVSSGAVGAKGLYSIALGCAEQIALPLDERRSPSPPPGASLSTP